MTEFQTPPHIGTLLLAYYKEKRIHKAALSRKIETNYINLMRWQKRASIHTDVLWELSQALQHNFFADIAQLLPISFSTTDATEKDQRISALEEENRLLKSQLALLERLMKKE